jgi:hypothetical protein
MKKLSKKVNQVFDNLYDGFSNSANSSNFPREIINIIVDYACYQNYGAEDLVKFLEARKFSLFTNRSYGASQIVSSFRYHHSTYKSPTPIFNSIFRSDNSEMTHQKIDIYATECQKILNMNFFDNCENFSIVFYRKVEYIKLYTSVHTDKPFELDTWEKFKFISFSSKKNDSKKENDLDWGNLFNIIYSCQSSGSQYQNILSIDFDYKKSKPIIIIKLD